MKKIFISILVLFSLIGVRQCLAVQDTYQYLLDIGYPGPIVNKGIPYSECIPRAPYEAWITQYMSHDGVSMPQTPFFCPIPSSVPVHTSTSSQKKIQTNPPVYTGEQSNDLLPTYQEQLDAQADRIYSDGARISNLEKDSIRIHTALILYGIGILLLALFRFKK